MDVECILSQERRSVITVLCDGSHWREVHTSIFGRRPTFPQGCTSMEEFEAVFTALECQCAKKYALKILSTQAMLSNRLARSLRERLVSDKTIDKVIHELIGLGLINDQEWVDSFIRIQTSRKMGPRAIAQKLAAKGVRGKGMSEALQSSYSSEEQKLAIQRLLETRYSKRNLKDRRDRQRVIAALSRRGFDLALILSAIDNIDCPFITRDCDLIPGQAL